ncbi:hypothetical protein WR25_14793 [Diploscapter pachys]|uniref:PEHE domain-containing protein n=1 Tax=Diploscapter pachys TaxID=2018661 RepID=A0A2A2KWY8_9BILA|nr:hypothetical protein WR25_14793 [Diploscapter pachys]
MRVVSNFDSLRLLSMRRASSKVSCSHRPSTCKLISSPVKHPKSEVSFIRNNKPLPRPSPSKPLPRSSLVRSKNHSLSIYANRRIKKILRSSPLTPVQSHKIAVHFSREPQKRSRLASINGRPIGKQPRLVKSLSDFPLPSPSARVQKPVHRMYRAASYQSDEESDQTPSYSVQSTSTAATSVWQPTSTSSSSSSLHSSNNSKEKLKPTSIIQNGEEVVIEDNKNKAMQLYRKVWKVGYVKPTSPALDYDSSDDEDRVEELKYYSKMERLEKQVLRKHNIWENEQRYRAALLKKPVENKADWSKTIIVRGK